MPRRRPGCEEENEAETGGGCEDEWGVRCKEGGGQAAVMSISAAAVTLASACAAGCCLVEAMRAVACRAEERFAATNFRLTESQGLLFSGDVFSRVRGWRVVEGCFGHCEKGARS